MKNKKYIQHYGWEGKKKSSSFIFWSDVHYRQNCFFVFLKTLPHINNSSFHESEGLWEKRSGTDVRGCRATDKWDVG